MNSRYLERATIIAAIIPALYVVAVFGIGVDVCYFVSDKSGCGMVMAFGVPPLLCLPFIVFAGLTVLSWVIPSPPASKER